MSIVRILLALVCVLAVTGCGRSDTSSSQAAIVNTTDFGTALRDLQLVTETAGWVLTDKALVWTSDQGNQWEKVKLPKEVSATDILGVFFLDPLQGWLVYPRMPADGTQQATFAVLQTTDGGKTWNEHTIAAMTSEFVGAAPASIDFVDRQHGWVALHLQSSSNFSAGVLFQTTDGGQTWVERTMPIGSPIDFITPTDGWTAGGAAGSELYVTRDGGQTWEAQSVTPPEMNGPVQATYDLPTFRTAQDGILPVTFTTANDARISFYATSDGGESWKGVTSTVLPSSIEPGVKPAVKAIDAEKYVVLLPNGKAKKTKDAGKSWEEGRAQEGIFKLSFANTMTGWALRAAGSCVKPKQQCSRETSVLSTADGGETWKALLSLKVKF